MPNQAEDSKPGNPASAAVGTSGSAVERRGDATAIARTRPAFTNCAIPVIREHELRVAGDQVLRNEDPIDLDFFARPPDVRFGVQVDELDTVGRFDESAGIQACSQVLAELERHAVCVRELQVGDCGFDFRRERGAQREAAPIDLGESRKTRAPVRLDLRRSAVCAEETFVVVAVSGNQRSQAPRYAAMPCKRRVLRARQLEPRAQRRQRVATRVDLGVQLPGEALGPVGLGQVVDVSHLRFGQRGGFDPLGEHRPVGDQVRVDP